MVSIVLLFEGKESQFINNMNNNGNNNTDSNAFTNSCDDNNITKKIILPIY